MGLLEAWLLGIVAIRVLTIAFSDKTKSQENDFRYGQCCPLTSCLVANISRVILKRTGGFQSTKFSSRVADESMIVWCISLARRRSFSRQSHVHSQHLSGTWYNAKDVLEGSTCQSWQKTPCAYQKHPSLSSNHLWHRSSRFPTSFLPASIQGTSYLSLMSQWQLARLKASSLFRRDISVHNAVRLGERDTVQAPSGSTRSER